MGKKNSDIQIIQEDEQVPENTVNNIIDLDKQISQIVESSNKRIGDIVDIDITKETNIFSIAKNNFLEKIYWALGIDRGNPVVFSQITETLNEYRSIIAADLYNEEDNKKAV